MKLCPNCKTKHSDSKKFCGKCGTFLAYESASDPETLVDKENLEARLRKFPDDVRILCEYGRFLFKHRLADEALKQFYRARTVAPGEVQISVEISQIHFESGDYDRCIRESRETLEKHPECNDLKMLVAHALHRSGYHAESLEIVSELLAANPTNVRALRLFRNILRNDPDQSSKLVDLCMQIATLDKTDWQNLEILTDTYLHSDNRDEAYGVFRKLHSLKPQHPRAILYVGIEQTQTFLTNGNEEALASARSLLESLDNSQGLSENDRVLNQLYSLHAELASGNSDLKQKSVLLHDIDITEIQQPDYPALARCFLLIAKLEQTNDLVESAVYSCELSLKYSKDIEIVLFYVRCLTGCGDTALRGQSYKVAKSHYERAHEYSPENSELTEKLTSINRKIKRRRNRTIGMIASSLLISASFLGYLFFDNGRLKISVDRNAEILLKKDGRSIWRGHDAGSFETAMIPTGEYSIQMKKPGFVPIDTVVNVSFGRGLTVVACQFVPLSAPLDIRTSPPGATVNVNGKSLGITPMVLEKVSTGQRLTLSRPGHYDTSITISVRASGITQKQDIHLSTFPNITWLGMIDSHDYCFYNVKMSWSEAVAYCNKEGGYLMTITDQAENAIAAKATYSYPAWIGFNDADNEGDWKWITEENADYLNWAPKQPYDSLGTEDFACIGGYFGGKPGGVWLGKPKEKTRRKWFSHQNEGNLTRKLDNITSNGLPFIIEFEIPKGE